MESRNQSRFSTLRVFKLAGAAKPPPPPPKDSPSNITAYLSSRASTSQLTLNTSPDSSTPPSIMDFRSPGSDDNRFLHPHSPITPQSPRSVSPSRSPPGASAFKKGLTKLSPFTRKPSRAQTTTLSTPTSSSPSLSALHERPATDSDSEGISSPWGFKHELHVNGDLQGLPPNWTASLVEAGFSDQEIADLLNRRRPSQTAYTDSSQHPSAGQQPTGDPPRFTDASSAPREPSDTIVRPKPRSDSLRRPLASRSESSSALSTVSTAYRSPSPTSSFTSSVPATSVHTTLADSAHSTPSYAQSQSHSQSSLHLAPESLVQSPSECSHSLSHGSGRSAPPALLPLRNFRVVNEDVTPAPLSPPPAYALPTPTRTMGKSPRGAQVQRGVSTEKTGLHEPSPSRSEEAPEPHDEPTVPYQREEAPVAETPLLLSEDVTNLALSPKPQEGEWTEEVTEDGTADITVEDHDVDPSELTSLPSPVSRTAALPPRLSLHTDQDDGWGDMFSFLPSTSRGSIDLSQSRITPSPSKSKRMSTLISISENPQFSAASNAQSKRRSKRFSNTLAIVPPTNYMQTIISPPPSESSQTRQPSSLQHTSSSEPMLSPPQSIFTASSQGSSPEPRSEYSNVQSARSELDGPDPEPSTLVTLYSPGRAPEDIGIFTPDPAYPIAESPLWQEVRVLVRDGATRRVSEEKQPMDSDVEATRLDSPEEAHRESNAQDALAHPIEPSSSLSPSLPPPPQSRFSDASSFFQRDSLAIPDSALHPPSRFSDATSFEGHSRFSDVTSVHDMRSPFSDMSSVIGESPLSAEPHSRFSEWSTHSHAHGHGHPSTLFSPLEPMPESPSSSKSQDGVFPPVVPTVFSDVPVSRKSNDLPPPRPPPKDVLPPPPTVADDESYLRLDDSHLDTSHLSHLSSISGASSISNVSAVQIHGATIATLSRADIVSVSIPPPEKKLSVTSTSAPASSSSRMGPSYAPRMSPHSQGPPPLPLPPLGKILPSLIASQRIKERRQKENSQDSAQQDSQESMVEADRLSPASASSSSHSTSESGIVFGYGERGQRRISASLSSSYEDPPKSPMLPYMESEPQRSPKPVVDVVRLSRGDGMRRVQSDDDDDTVPLQHLRQKLNRSPQAQGESGWVDDDDDDEPMDGWLEDTQSTSEHGVELEASVMDSPEVYDHDAPPMTPAITVNGFHVSNPDESSSKADAVVQRELPPVLAPLAEYIYLDFDPREMFTASQEVAQGQYGSVYAAHVNAGVVNDPDSVVAVKQVPIPAGGSPKIGQLLHELSLMSQVRHKHILTTDGLFFDGVGEMLWIRMELMERSLADVLVLNEDGFQLEERVMARFASDVLLALVYLGDLDIAHRDVRSDNLLINSDGVLKLADFSNAVRVTQEGPMCVDIVGVHHWQAPEMRSGPYNASKVDVWSLGATIWETAEGVPPFVDIEDPSALSDRWPPLSEAEEFTDIFHDFLRLCSEPPESRPPASQLLHNPFIQLACPRDDILQVLSLCRTIEEQIQQRENGDP